MASLTAAAVARSLLTGMGRASMFSLRELFMTDRYYAFLLAPAALGAAFLIPGRWLGAAVAALLLIPAGAQVRRTPGVEASFNRARSLAPAMLLAAMIEDEVRPAGVQGLTLMDEFVRVPEIHKDGMNLAAVVCVTYPDDLPRLCFAGSLTQEEKSRQESLLLRGRLRAGLLN